MELATSEATSCLLAGSEPSNCTTGRLLSLPACLKRCKTVLTVSLWEGGLSEIGHIRSYQLLACRIGAEQLHHRQTSFLTGLLEALQDRFNRFAMGRGSIRDRPHPKLPVACLQDRSRAIAPQADFFPYRPA